jgi:hypothetical protein
MIWFMKYVFQFWYLHQEEVKFLVLKIPPLLKMQIRFLTGVVKARLVLMILTRHKQVLPSPKIKCYRNPIMFFLNSK